MKRSIMMFGAMVAMASTALLAKDGWDYGKDRTKPGMFQNIETAKEVEVLPDEAEIAMACKKCKSVTILVKKEIATKPGHGTVTEKLTVDQCPGCGGKITTKSSGKETAMVHTCSECGDDSAYCCAALAKKKEKTKGMKE